MPKQSKGPYGSSFALFTHFNALSNNVCNRLLLRGGSLLSLLKRGIQTLELDARISGGKAPSDGGGLLIAMLLLGLDLWLQFF